MQTEKALEEITVVLTRVIWGAMILGQVAFLVTAWAIRGAAAPVAILGVLVTVGMALVTAAVPGAFLLRHVLLRARPVGVGRYRMGHLLPLAALEAPSLLAVVALLIGANALPVLLIPAVAIAAQVAMFPTAAPFSAAGKDYFRVGER